MRSALFAASVAALSIGACTQQPASVSPAPVAGTGATVAAPAAGPAMGASGAPGAQAAPRMTPEQIAARNDSLQKDRMLHVNEIRAQIAGKEQLPAEQVYKNIQSMKGTPAGRLLNIMSGGYSNSLGVSCSHCHVIGEYDREDKPTKQIARDMSAMVRTINGTLLKEIKNLKSPDAVINCGTCHNGRARPGAGSAAMPAPR
jgi:Photosynthetic reaction centre cytochrome C subunit